LRPAQPTACCSALLRGHHWLMNLHEVTKFY
jgi:hypothetical protein